jgi:hypothetical protein
MPPGGSPEAEVDYVLPIRWSDPADEAGLPELTDYLRWLADHVRVIVVDGSPPVLFALHAEAWAGLVLHVAPDPAAAGDGPFNGKVLGVRTGLRLATAGRAVIADDDVRYDERTLRAVLAQLDDHDLVGPQNVFRPLPWHARWDTGRTLLNRAFGADYPGTFAVRTATFRRMGGYDAGVLFENLELMRTVQAAGGRVRRARDLYVVRRPPAARRFWNQRVRQAYDDLAQPGRLIAELAIAPAALLALRRGRPGLLLAGAALTVAAAEVGRRRDGGAAWFPATTSYVAPLWLTERGCCVWAAVALRVARGGVAYGGARLRTAAHSRRALAAKLAQAKMTPAATTAETAPAPSAGQAAVEPSGVRSSARSVTARMALSRRGPSPRARNPVIL